MAQGNKITNTVLAIVALLLLWICVRSIFAPAPADGKKAATEAAASKDSTLTNQQEHKK